MSIARSAEELDVLLSAPTIVECEPSCSTSKSTGGGGGGGRGKSQYPYVGLNSPIEIILFGIRYDLLTPLVRGICQIEKYSCSFLHLFDSLHSRIEPNFIGLCLAIRITFVLKT